MQLGPAEILVVLVIALLVFGPTKLPEVGRQVGQAYRELRRFQRSLSSEMRDVFADDEAIEDVSDGAAPAPALPPKPSAATGAPPDAAPDVTADADPDAAPGVAPEVATGDEPDRP